MNGENQLNETSRVQDRSTENIIALCSGNRRSFTLRLSSSVHSEGVDFPCTADTKMCVIHFQEARISASFETISSK